jgi:hypothetical protein
MKLNIMVVTSFGEKVNIKIEESQNMQPSSYILDLKNVSRKSGIEAIVSTLKAQML